MKRLPAAAFLVTIAIATTASAQGIQDHLACVKIKDTIPKGAYTIANTIDLYFTGTNWTGCVMKTPARQFCRMVSKIGVSPTPPGGGPAGPILDHNANPFQGFFCYKVKCPKVGTVVAAHDQFGTRSITVPPSAPKVFCAPASPSGAFLDDSRVF